MFRNDDGQLCPTEYKTKPNMKHPAELTWSIKFHIIVKIEERTIDSSMFGSRSIRNGFERNSALNQYPILNQQIKLSGRFLTTTWNCA